MSALSQMAVEGQEEDKDTKATTFQSQELEGTFSWTWPPPGWGHSPILYLFELPGDHCCPKAVGLQISSRGPQPPYPGG